MSPPADASISPAVAAPVAWSFPTRILYGAGAASTVGAEAARLGLRRVLLLSDPGVAAAGVTRPVEQSLDEAKIEWELFSAVSSNPTEAEVLEAVRHYRERSAEGVVAVGGGAPIDVAKLVVVRACVDRPFEELDDAKGGDRYVPAELPPVLAVPTTAGTGSEVGRAAVLTVASTGVKTVVFGPAMMPRLAVLDPLLSVSLPPGATAATGFDALTHCLEAYLARGQHPLADGIALAGLEIVAASLRRVVEDGTDVQARGAMLQAAMMGAAAFQKGLGACHSLSHPLSAELGVHHGLANALCLPAVVDFNEGVVPERVRRVGALFGASAEPGGCGRALRELAASVGIGGGLSAVGVTEAQIPRLATLAFQDGCHQQNPRPCGVPDFEALYRAAL